MKKFTFPLGRAMEFRGMQTRIEEMTLEGLYAELRAIEAREVALIQERVASEKGLRAAPSVTGFDLALFDSYRQGMKEEQKRIDKARGECRKKIDGQLQVLMVKRRDVKLLEHLKEQRFEKWEREMFKDIDQQAEGTYLAKWT